jgi:hypothetical protein
MNNQDEPMREPGTLSIDSVVVRVKRTMDAEVDDEIVALNLDTGASYGLNAVGARIWKLIAKPTRVAEMCAGLVAEYAVEPSTCEREVLDLLGKLQAESLLEVTAAPGVA